MRKFRISKFILLSLALHSFPSQAMEIFCGTSFSDESHSVRYKVELDGRSNWGHAVVSLVEGNPLHYLPSLPFAMRCENSYNLVLCRLSLLDSSSPAPIFLETTFKWDARTSESNMTLTFKTWNHDVKYRCQE